MSPAIASTGDFSWEEDLTEDLRLFNEEWKKSGGFDIDFSKLRHKFETGAVDLDDDDLKCYATGLLSLSVCLLTLSPRVDPSCPARSNFGLKLACNCNRRSKSILMILT
ncbi:hypothetical protein Bca52824_072653 [Brassica carinata]|uniref:Uncharacterized protein n=1 Tax=Brassica carinata TaxID=52824 RepID=A0A8X7U553_BRACI|nr:hypothetical protein Bca52824_072653 [Brassica carinata]